MKALSLTQPWASLIAAGHKRYETRSWSTAYRGPIAIHAAKSIDRGACYEFGRWLDSPALPRGAVIAIALLSLVERTDHAIVGSQERQFGDFSPGRFAWRLIDVRAIEPQPALGHLGIWNWEPTVPIKVRHA